MRPFGRDQKKVARNVPTITVDERTARQIFGGNVVHRRESMGLTRAQCAERAAVDIDELIAIEAGTGEPGVFTVARVAEVFGCEADDLMGDIRWIPVVGGHNGRGHYELD
jgi:transcriptional regulator with XRE-family HTH domain